MGFIYIYIYPKNIEALGNGPACHVFGSGLVIVITICIFIIYFNIYDKLKCVLLYYASIFTFLCSKNKSQTKI
jgi:hypothetical protein